jgi:hypothetical protein
MQKHYHHSVPKDTTQVGLVRNRRIALVFRSGREEYYFGGDTGRQLESLHSRDCSLGYCIGRVPGLEEGSVYSRNSLIDMKAHCMAQKGISGNKDFGCDAIIVSGARKDGEGLDNFNGIVYCAETTVGGGSLLKSMALKNCIRVFRSSKLQNPYQAHQGHAGNQKKNASAIYRYDGLYRVTKVSFLQEGSGTRLVDEEPEHLSPIVTGRLYHFHLTRVEAGTEACTNELADNRFLHHCRSLGTMKVLV